MKVYTYSEARQRLADVLNIARTEEVVIKRRGGETFSTRECQILNYELLQPTSQFLNS